MVRHVLSSQPTATQFELEHLGASMSEAIERMRCGEEVTISDHGQPVAKLVPMDAKERVFGAFKGRVIIADDFDAPLPESFRAEFEK